TGNTPPPPARIHRTHTSDAVTAALNSLSFAEKLKFNKGVEDANNVRALQTINNARNPAAHPNPGSPAASFIELSEDDLHTLLIPGSADALKAHFTDSVSLWLSQQQKKDTPSGKRPAADDGNTPASTSKKFRPAFSPLVSYDPSTPISVVFKQIFHDSEEAGALPLSFFTYAAIERITNESGIICTRKANSNDGSTQAARILDVDKL
ncbi:hypothetical protein BJ165DRAFT_1321649, partial [Panaeolus papilionaceus]